MMLAALFSLLGSAHAYSNIVMRPLPSTASKPEACIILCQGANILASDYVDLATAIQKSTSNFALWVGIPSFLDGIAEPAVMDLTLNGMLSELKSDGMKATDVVYAGHSLGGAMIQNWVASNPDKAKAQILMGALLVRTYKDVVYKTPTLTLGGEFDGLMRFSRMAENVYRYTQHPLKTEGEDFPVIVFPGFNHMSFAGSETQPSFVLDNDIASTVPLAVAHTTAASVISAFLEDQLSASPPASAALLISQASANTVTMVTPLITAFKMEGFNQFLQPCYCAPLNCVGNSTCLAGCPWTEQFSQRTMSALDDSSAPVDDSGMVTAIEGTQPKWGGPAVSLDIRDSFHRLYTMPPVGTVHLPQIYDGEGGGTFEVGDEWNLKGTVCPAITSTTTSEVTCSLKISTVSQSIYNVIDTELDTGFQPVAATEIKTKMRSRQSSWVAAGNATASFDALDGGYKTTFPNLCAEINQRSLDWAKSNAAPAALAMYESKGIPLVIGADKGPYNAGPLWIWTYMEYDNQPHQTVVRAPMMKTEVDYPIGAAAGFHYCKILSPARAMEWIYVDSLKPRAAASASSTTVPPGFSLSTSTSGSDSSPPSPPPPAATPAVNLPTPATTPSPCEACVSQARSIWC